MVTSNLNSHENSTEVEVDPHASYHAGCQPVSNRVCPTSNRRIGGITDPAHHPIGMFLASDAPFVIATDDPGIFGATLAGEMAWAAEHHDLPDDAPNQIAARSWASRSEVLTGREPERA